MKKTIAMILTLCLTLTVLGTCAFADGGYQIKVVDPDGNPVEGVMVQFCSDTECLMQTTDDNGLAAFDKPAGSYTAHLLKVPAGYEKDDTEYAVPETPDTVVLAVKPEGATAEEEAADVIDAPQIGVYYKTPEALANLKGQVHLSYNFLDDGVLDIPVTYLAVSKADMDAYMTLYRAAAAAFTNGEEMPTDPDHPTWLSGYESLPLYDIFIINDNRGETELHELLKGVGLGDDAFCNFTEIGSDADNHFFLTQYAGIMDSADELKPLMGEFFDEYEKLFNDPSLYLSGLKLSAPEWPNTKKAGEVFTFKTTDLDGNAVDSAELFSKAKVTMVNCWGTWCNPCRAELPELGKMAKELEEQGCQLVGLCTDAFDDAVAATAKQLLSDADASYLNLRCTEEIEEDISLTAWPTTYFVDSEGKLLTDPFEGANPATYRAMLADCLAQLG